MTIQSEETKIAVMANDIAYIKKSQDRIEASVKELTNVYATKQELKEVVDKTTALERSSNIWKVISPSIAAILGSVITFLIIQFLQNAQ